MIISQHDLNNLKKAGKLLEKDSLLVRLANIFGSAAGRVLQIFYKNTENRLELAGMAAIDKSWEFSITTMSDQSILPESDKKHKGYALLSGAIGGAGIISLIAELPVTTVIMMRAVADAAKGEGEDFRQFETKLACLQAFALGGDVLDPDTGETGYYATRMLLEKPLDESVRYIAAKGAAGMGAPFAAQLITKIAAKYQTYVSARIAANAIPVAGAVMGATINIVFIDYFQEKARGHFIIRRLEKKYSMNIVKKEYKKIQAEIAMEKASYENTDKIIRHHTYAATSIGLVPVPIVDLIGVSGIQLLMLDKLARAYGISFSRYKAKQLVAVLIGGIFPASFGVIIGGSLTKFVPFIGQTLGSASVPLTAGASTYAIGKVFNRHFAQGGTFLNFDPKKAEMFYAEMFKNGQNSAAKLLHKTAAA